MNKNRSVLIYLVSVLAAVLVLCAAVEVLHRAEEDNANVLITRVSVILPHKDDGYWNLIEEGILEAQEANSDGMPLDINILIPQLNYSIPQMTDLLKQQIAAKVDYIVVQGNEDEEFRAVLLDAMEQGIQVILVDTDINDFPEHLYVGTDNYAAGKLLGEQLLLLTGGTARIAVISGEERYQNMQQRLAGFQDAIASAPESIIAKIVYDNYDGLTVMRLYQELTGVADTLVCLEGTGGNTLETRYDKHGEEYKYVVGFDAYKGARNGVLDGIIKQDTGRMGQLVVEEIMRHMETGSYSSDCIYTDIFWLTAENYDEVMQ